MRRIKHTDRWCYIGGLSSAGITSAGIDFFGSKSLQDDAQSSARRIAADNREWQEKMYKNRFQYSMEDMKAAGLNPILAASMGLGGGQVPSGGVSSGSAPGYSGGSKGAQVSINKKRVEEEIKVMAASAHKQGMEAQKAGAETDYWSTAAQLERMKIPKGWREQQMWEGKMGEYVPYIRELTPVLNTASGIAGTLGLLKNIGKWKKPTGRYSQRKR